MTAAERLASRIPVPTASRFIDTDAGRLHCLVAGSGPPLLLVHGLNIGWGEWFAVLPALAERHTVYALDLPGAGDSFRVDLTADGIPGLFIEAVRETLRAVAPGGADVIGHSLGAWAALNLASRQDQGVRSVTAVSPVGFTAFVPPKFRPLALRPLARLMATVLMPPTRENIGTFLVDVMADPSMVIPEYAEYVHEHVNRPPASHPFFLIHRLLRPFRFREEFVFTDEELGAIRCPVAFVHGTEDPLIPAAAVRGRFGRVRDAKISLLGGVGHVPPIERPGSVLAALHMTSSPCLQS